MTVMVSFSNNGREPCVFAENQRYQMHAPAFPQRRKGAKKSEI
jgi:hypothetical protein